jgi:LL-diaminopimelate aminotransferase
VRSAKKIETLPPYLFAEIDRKVAAKRAQGMDVISLGIGDPDMPTPPHIVDELCRAVREIPATHRYPSYEGMPAYRQAAADWCERRFGERFDADTEVLALIGSKEGLAHLLVAYLDPGDVVLVPDPGYPAYAAGAILTSGVPYLMPLRRENDFLPDLGSIPRDVLAKTKLMFINYPNNPTSAIVRDGFFEVVVAFAKKHDILVCHDNAYSDIAFDGYEPPCFLATPGARDVGIELFSLSKLYNMTGWRCAFAVGNPEAIAAFRKVKTNVDSGIFSAVQYAGIAALESPPEVIAGICATYARRRDIAMPIIRELGLEASEPKATIYIWVTVPDGHTSSSFATLVLDKAGVVVSPGAAYGPSGEGYVRLSLTLPDERLVEAMERIRATL